ncbi:hypothetical protein [Streptomyces mobaraensis]|nr:hypothetical protein [Streptomyces mobaraensis]
MKREGEQGEKGGDERRGGSRRRYVVRVRARCPYGRVLASFGIAP